uniref:NAGPA domain-containing protein n=1 Tax=Bursaphelenchus xylophilus TaxID=6326 RepID=A0A1I7S2D5_BURXY
MKTYLDRIILLVLLQNFVYSKTYYYIGDRPHVFVKFSANDTELKTADLEIETFETFFIGLECAKVYNCTTQKTPESKAYDGSKYPASPTGKTPDISFGVATLHTTEYRGYLGSALIEADDKALFNVVESSSKNFFISHSGIIGLNVDPNNPESQAIRLFKSLKENKQIIVGRGPFYQTVRQPSFSLGCFSKARAKTFRNLCMAHA